MMVMQLSIKLATALVLLGKKCILSAEETSTSLQKSCTELCPGIRAGKLAAGILSICWTWSFFCVAEAGLSERVLSVFLGVVSCCCAEPYFTSGNASSDIEKNPFMYLSLSRCELAPGRSSASKSVRLDHAFFCA